jgi:hypothetical protein
MSPLDTEVASAKLDFWMTLVMWWFNDNDELVWVTLVMWWFNDHDELV